jgi:hypothetical protein
MTLTFLEWNTPFVEHPGLGDLDPLTLRMAANWRNKKHYPLESRFSA